MGFNLIITVGLLLFCLGALFAFTIVLPILLGFFARLNTSGTVTAMVSVQEYVSYVISTMLIFGPTKLPKLGKAIGQTIGNFKRSSAAAEKAEEKHDSKES